MYRNFSHNFGVKHSKSSPSKFSEGLNSESQPSRNAQPIKRRCLVVKHNSPTTGRKPIRPVQAGRFRMFKRRLLNTLILGALLIEGVRAPTRNQLRWRMIMHYSDYDVKEWMSEKCDWMSITKDVAYVEDIWNLMSQVNYIEGCKLTVSIEKQDDRTQSWTIEITNDRYKFTQKLYNKCSRGTDLLGDLDISLCKIFRPDEAKITWHTGTDCGCEPAFKNVCSCGGLIFEIEHTKYGKVKCLSTEITRMVEILRQAVALKKPDQADAVN